MSLSDRTPPNDQEYARYRERFSNWGRSAFQLVVAPLPLEGGTGSPVHPIAVL